MDTNTRRALEWLAGRLADAQATGNVVEVEYLEQRMKERMA